MEGGRGIESFVSGICLSKGEYLYFLMTSPERKRVDGFFIQPPALPNTGFNGWGVYLISDNLNS
jgi:hypothetical protein